MKLVKVLLLLSFVFSAGCSCNGFPIPDLPEKLIGHCKYKNGFSGLNECKEYLGGWSKDEAANDCKGNDSKIVLNTKCGIAEDKRFGDCIFIVDKKKDKYARVELPGTDATKCASMERGCEFFGGGSFVPTALCGGQTNNTPTGTLPTFLPPERICKDPKAGEPDGKGPNGQVCTWSAIAGATEPGRNFGDYGSCKVVRTQRPYYPVPPAATAKDDDPRMKDPVYRKENDWVKAQVRASACVCCHSTSAPKGPSNWYLESGTNWIKSMGPRGLAMGAGWIDTLSFGAYPADKNNGFSRVSPQNPGHSAFPTTDNERMIKFFEAELQARGKTRADFKNEKYGAGPLDIQREFKPKECTSAESISADGVLKWQGGPARYIYVLKVGSQNPGVPPNLDIPSGTLWYVGVDAKKGTPIESGSITYGKIPKGANATQRFPVNETPKKLESGKKYYLHVLKDIAFPLSRCYVTVK